MCSLVSSMSPWRRRERDKDIEDTGEHRCAHSCPVHPRSLEERDEDMSEHISAHLCPRCPHGVKGRGIRTYRTQASTNVLARVLCICAVSKRERQGQEQALMCSLMSLMSPWRQRERDKDIQDTGEHQCARSCPVRPHSVEERETRAQANTNVLTRVLCIHMVLKREREGHE